jgi:hypothetical protein
MFNRIFGMLRQRYYLTDDETGAAAEVAANHPGATAAAVLDSLDGDFLVRRIEDLEAKVTAPVPVEVDYDRIIDGVVDKLGGLRFVANPGVA